MLKGKKRGGHEDGHLLASKHGLIRGAQGNLGLAVAHVAAEQAIHGNGADHILFDLVGGGQLALGLLIGKGVLKGLLVAVVQGEGMPRPTHTLGVEADQILGHVLGGRFGTRLGLLPGLASHAGELDLSVLGTRTDIFGDLLQLFHGEKELVASRVADADVVARHALAGQRLNARVLSNAVAFVDHIVPDLKLGVGEDALGVLAFFLAQGGSCTEGKAAARIGAQGEQCHVGNGKLKSGYRFLPEHAGRSALHALGILAREQDASLLQARLPAVRVGLVFGQYQTAVAALQIRVQILKEELLVVRVANGVTGAEAEEACQTLVGQIVRDGVHVQGDVFVAEGLKIGGLLGVFGVFRGNRSPLQKLGHGLVQVPERGLQPIVHGARSADQHERRGIEIGHQRGLFGVDQGDILVEEAKLAAAFCGRIERTLFLDQLLQRALVRGLAELCLHGLLQIRHGGGVGQELACRRKGGRADRLRHALGVGVKEPHAVDLVAEQLYAQGVGAVEQLAVAVKVGAVRGINVQNAAAQGELSGTVHQIHACKAGFGQACGKAGKIQPLLLADLQGGVAQTLRRDGVAEQGVGGGDDGVVASREKPGQHAKPLMLVLMGGGNVIEGEIPRHIEGGADAVALKRGGETDAVLFLGAEQKGTSSAALLDRILQEGD